MNLGGSSRGSEGGMAINSSLSPDVRLELVREALSLAGHGLNPDDAITIARRYLNGVEVLPGSIVTEATVGKALLNLERAKERRARC